MPYVQCPVCQTLFHLSIRGDPADWERQLVKERAPNGTPLLKCAGCWVELRPGHAVKIRLVPEKYKDTLSTGQKGVVQGIVEGGASEILVAFDEVQAAFQREELSYVMGQPPVA